MTLTQEQMDAVERVRRTLAGEESPIDIYGTRNDRKTGKPQHRYLGHKDAEELYRSDCMYLVEFVLMPMLSDRKQPGCAGEEGA